MKVEPIEYGRWPTAYRCTVGAGELVVVSAVGPRILSLRWKSGSNLLYEDTSNFSVGAWRLYGGHRFTVAPEGAETYAPDNEPAEVEIRGRELRLAAPMGRDGIRRVLSVSAASAGDGFELAHILENHGRRPWAGALWGITCVSAASSVLGSASSGAIRFWPGSDDSRRQAFCRLESGCVVIAPDGTRAKVGWHSDSGWLASLNPVATLIIHCPQRAAVDDCVDGGCNLEVFACREYVELETLSPATVLAPGGHAEHVQHWRLLPPFEPPHDYPGAAAVVRNVCPHSNSCCVS